MMASDNGRAGQRILLALFVLALVSLAFARAEFASSTGIRIAGDGVDYEAVAGSMRLEGRAPFIYRPAVPLLVGALFADNLILGFAAVSALSMFVALFLAGALAKDTFAGFALATVLFFNYQVLFAAANVARLDVVVLALQLVFVAWALRGRSSLFFGALPLCALVKESMLLGLAALALAAFPRDRRTAVKAAAAGVGFVAIHLLVRAASTPTAAVPPYDDGLPGVAALMDMLTSNLSEATVLQLFVAWSGLAFIAVWLAFGGGSRPVDPALPAASAFLLLFPLPLATDVHRAWFELLAPMVLFLVLQRLTPENRGATNPALALALVASVIPYAVRFVAEDHLHLLLFEERFSLGSLVGMGVALITAAVALGYWMTLPPQTRSSSAEPVEGEVGR